MKGACLLPSTQARLPTRGSVIWSNSPVREIFDGRQIRLSGPRTVPPGLARVRLPCAENRTHPRVPVATGTQPAPRANFTAQFDSIIGREVIAKRLAGHISRAGPAEALMPEVTRGAPEKGPWWRQLRLARPRGWKPRVFERARVPRDKDRSW